MPYKTKAERERENWMTLPDAVAHIQSSDQCDDVGAVQRQLHAALADGALKPLKWEREPDDRPPPFGYTPVMSPADTPPIGHDWLIAKICWNAGTVRDDWSEHKNGKWRVLLVHRLSVVRQWPPSAPSDMSASTSYAKKAKEHATQSKQHRASPQTDRARKALAEIYPNGVPDQSSKPNKVLLKEVNDRLARMIPPLEPVKIDSLTRAADRRNK
jgi:hypothetical protein